MFTADKRHSPHTLHMKKPLAMNPSRTTCGTRDSSSHKRQENENTGNLTVMTIDKKKDPMGAAILEAVTSRHRLQVRYSIANMNFHMVESQLLKVMLGNRAQRFVAFHIDRMGNGARHP